MNSSGGGLKSARWLRSFKQAPIVTGFHNIESGQVVFSQTLGPQQYYVDRFFKYSNKQNRKPTTRKDLWRTLVVAETNTHEEAVQIFKNLLELRDMRDHTNKVQARTWRRKSENGKIWHQGQFRPTYTHEAVADLISAFSALNSKGKLYWDHLYRPGNLEAWSEVDIEHKELPLHNPREQQAVLNSLRAQSLQRVREHMNDLRIQCQRVAKEARAAGLPTPAEQKADMKRVFREERLSQQKAAEAARAKLRDEDPLLRAMDEKEQIMIGALERFKQATRDRHMLRRTPEPTMQEKKTTRAIYKMRRTAARKATRDYRTAKRYWKTQGKKGQVVQSKHRLAMRLH